MEFEIRPTPATFQDFLVFQKAIRRKNTASGGDTALRVITTIIGVMTLWNGMTGLLSEETDTFTILYVLLGIALITTGILRPYIRAYSQYRKSKRKQKRVETTIITFGDTQIQLAAESMTIQLQYSQVTSILHMEGRYYVGLLGKKSFIFPERDFVSGNPELFGDFLEERCSQKVQYIK